MDDKRLQRVQAYASIGAYIVVPLLIAIFGWLIQSRMSSDAVRKDYVQMAIGILSNKDTKSDKELREWASKIIRHSSPVPFGKEVQASLASGSITITPIPKSVLETNLMEPPEPWLPLVAARPLPADDLIVNYAQNLEISNRNALKLEYLQKLVRSLAGSESGPRAKEQATQATSR